jgi:hypothetical protein
MTLQTLIGFAAVFVGLLGYIPYYRDTLRGTTKPHPFTWLGFGCLNAISFFAQISRGGGAGAWTTAVSAVCIFGVFALALNKGEKDITTFDWICFGGTVLSILLWVITKEPLVAVIIVTIADILAFAPTFRKGYLRPDEETAIHYALSTLKYLLSLFALTAFNLTTFLFPLSVAIVNFCFVLLLLIRRGQLKKLLYE